MTTIASIHAEEILDSRGKPTVYCSISTSNGHEACASSPSGASTGILEAHELRDNDPKRYGGQGVLKAVGHINNIIAPKLIGMNPSDQDVIDQHIIELDGQPNKSHLGANALLPVSLAVAKVAAKSNGLSFCDYLSGGNHYLLPTPMINIINGGAHANNHLSIQEFMIIPWGFDTFSRSIRASAEVIDALGKLLDKRGYSTAVGDEGGFAPALNDEKAALDLLLQAIEQAGYRPYDDIALAVDVAASGLYRDGFYHLSGKKPQDQSRWIDCWTSWLDQYPIVSIEDACAEQDWSAWTAFTQALGNRVQLVGDDLFVTHSHLLKKGIEKQAANAILIKPNQVGTLSETLRTMGLASQAGYNTIISHRSGETEDCSIAHLAVASDSGQIKTGSLCRGERIAKYNTLLHIEHQHKNTSIYSGKTAFEAWLGA
jgi:enolase